MADIKLKLKQFGVSAIRMFWGAKMKEKCVYYNHMKEWPNLEEPMTWGEKLLWLNHHWQPEIKSLCADKYRVCEFLKQQGLENILVDLLGVWDKAEDIDFDKLPDKFVLKCWISLVSCRRIFHTSGWIYTIYEENNHFM